MTKYSDVQVYALAKAVKRACDTTFGDPVDDAWRQVSIVKGIVDSLGLAGEQRERFLKEVEVTEKNLADMARVERGEAEVDEIDWYPDTG